MNKILIGLCHRGFIGGADSGMCVDFKLQQYWDLKGRYPFLGLWTRSGYGLERQRNDLVRDFMYNPEYKRFDYLYLDSDDIIVKSDCFIHFIQTEHDILVAPVMIKDRHLNIFSEKRINPQTGEYGLVNYTEIPGDEFEVHYCGLTGMFSRKVFEKTVFEAWDEFYRKKYKCWFKYNY